MAQQTLGPSLFFGQEVIGGRTESHSRDQAASPLLSWAPSPEPWCGSIE